MICSVFNLVTSRMLQGVVQMKSFYRKKGGARELLAKENKELFLEQDTFFGRKWEGIISISGDCLFSLGEVEGLTGRLPPWCQSENSRLVD